KTCPVSRRWAGCPMSPEGVRAARPSSGSGDLAHRGEIWLSISRRIKLNERPRTPSRSTRGASPIQRFPKMLDPTFTRCAFLPEEDPLEDFPHDSELSVLDRLGRDLPSLLQDKSFRGWARGLHIPALAAAEVPLPRLRLYYVRLGFLASAYVNQVGL